MDIEQLLNDVTKQLQEKFGQVKTFDDLANRIAESDVNLKLLQWRLLSLMKEQEDAQISDEKIFQDILNEAELLQLLVCSGDLKMTDEEERWTFVVLFKNVKNAQPHPFKTPVNCNKSFVTVSKMSSPMIFRLNIV